MSTTIGSNLIAKPVISQIREQAPAIKPDRIAPESIPVTVESTVTPLNSFIPSSPAVLPESTTEVTTGTFAEAEGTTFGDVGDLLEWTDDVPEMKEDFVEVEVEDNRRVEDSTGTDDSEDDEQEGDGQEPFNGMSDGDVPGEELAEAFAA